ncbi:enoyl-CoA hydratase/carnithine racemase [Rhodococcus sp. OK611]|uniref:enoyl-CoA hydratase n=1 Tax=unclassified Rhodococcus (in: high G+C Gram-positive bacteria) TaxID=192944 RepID=UPI000BCAA922|nr:MULTISPECIES: enoyl-CoA hydratase [unclassified Rhodococcus (in: high G+C Gram-positive bacteria)]PTR44103.1 enoyl-CoA hydratase/carnithine racemase [Rhodococcus sp. OK611]SNX90405.1 Enoyl-CoA hydratase/carnithine racemase [Rhodococcus sp. OK270]
MTATPELEVIAGLRVEFGDGILRITIDRQERMNAIDLATMDAMGDLLTGRAKDPSVRVVVIGGARAAFSTGADLAAAADGPEADPRVVMDSANRVVRATLTLPIPVIAEVNGAAAGVGASIAFAADLAFASPSAYFLLAFVNVGLMPDGGSSLLVPAAIGRARASEMALLGRKLGATDAAAAGLIARVLPEGELSSHVRAVAAKLSRGPRRAIELTKRALTTTTLARIDETLERETEGQIELLAAPDFREGVAAMLGGRAPEFGR